MKCIIVEDYIWDGNKIFGVFDSIRNYGTPEAEDVYILDDGDMYTEKELKESGYIYYLFNSDEIINFYFDFLMNKLKIVQKPECPHTKKKPTEWGGTLCVECNEHLDGWFCPKSSDNKCKYTTDLDHCDFCGQPQERK